MLVSIILNMIDGPAPGVGDCSEVFVVFCIATVAGVGDCTVT